MQNENDERNDVHKVEVITVGLLKIIISEFLHNESQDMAGE